MIKREGSPLGIGGQYKITAEHSKRLVYIYIRQSTLKQVERNKGVRSTSIGLSNAQRLLVGVESVSESLTSIWDYRARGVNIVKGFRSL